MSVFLSIALLLVAAAVVICVACVIVGVRAEVRFDEHVRDDLDMIADDHRNTRLNANATGTGWY